MKTIIFMPNATPDERVDALNKICYNRGEDTFMRNLTESEIAVEKDKFLDLFKEEQVLKDEAKESAQIFAKKVSAAVAEREEVYLVINTRQREVRDKLYWVIDNINGNMNFFDRYGELIKTRKLTPDETNGVLFNMEGANASEAYKEIPYLKDEPQHIQDIDFEELDIYQEGNFDNDEETGYNEDNEAKTTPSDKEPTETPKKVPKKRKPKETPDND